MADISIVDIESILSRTNEAIAERIAEINQTTEQEILALGECIFRIVERSQANIEHTEGAMDKVLHAHRAQEEAIVQYNRQVALFQDELESKLKLLQDITTKAVTFGSRIAKLGRRLDGLSMASKVLSINANIEAGRSNQYGFQVIAQQIQQLSGETISASGEIEQIATDMLELLPSILEQTTQIRAGAERTNDSLQPIQAQVEQSSVALQDAVRQSREVGAAGLSKILKDSEQASAHIRFQDPVAQKVASIGKDVSGLSAQVLAAITGEELVAEEEPVAEEGDDMELDSGELLLF